MTVISNLYFVINCGKSVLCLIILLQHGAEAIYIPKMKETLRDFEVLNNHLPDYGVRKLLISSDKQIASDITATLSHFGCVRNNNYDELLQQFNYSLCSLNYPSIISSLVYYDNKENGYYDCDSLAPMVTLQIGLFSNIQLFGSMFFKDAFWCLPLESGFDNIQWQTVVQYVQWIIGGRIAIFHGKNNLHASKITTNFANARLINHLQTITCTKNKDINTSQCVRKILQAMFQWNILPKKSDLSLTKWFAMLEKHVHLYFESSTHKVHCSLNKVLYKPSDRTRTVNLTYSPSVMNVQKQVQKTCASFTHKQSLNDVTRTMQNNIKQINDKLLIIIFNNAIYDAIPYMEILFRSFYPYALYCGPEPPQRVLNVSFVSYSGNHPGHRPGSFNYECVILAYNIFPYMPGGYFVIGDDVLLFPHLLLSLPSDKIWFISYNGRAIVDFGQKCEIRQGRCVNKEMVNKEHLKVWFLEYYNNSKTLLFDFHKQAQQSGILQK